MWEKREGRERKTEKVGRGEPAGGASVLGQGRRHQRPLSFSSIAFGWTHSHYPSSNTLLCLRAALSPLGLVLWVLAPSWLNYNGKAARPLRKGVTEGGSECAFIVWSLSVYTLLMECECEVTSQSPAPATMPFPPAAVTSHHDGMTPIMTLLNCIWSMNKCLR